MLGEEKVHIAAVQLFLIILQTFPWCVQVKIAITRTIKYIWLCIIIFTFIPHCVTNKNNHSTAFDWCTAYNLIQKEAQSASAESELISAQQTPHKPNNKDPSCLPWFSPGMQVSTRYINSTTGVFSAGVYVSYAYALYLMYHILACQVRVQNNSQHWWS